MNSAVTVQFKITFEINVNYIKFLFKNIIRYFHAHQFESDMKYNMDAGVFTDIFRAWVIIDNTIYIFDYSNRLFYSLLSNCNDLILIIDTNTFTLPIYLKIVVTSILIM